MQDPKLIVLGLLGIGLKYGFEMEAFVEHTEMRQWAKIGMSTIYKTLKDLVRDGAVTSKRAASDKGPARNAYALSKKGRAMLTVQVQEAMSSQESVYSDRIAGLVFAPLLAREKAVYAINGTIAGLTHADELLMQSLAARPDDPIAEAVIGFYRDVYAAERKAMAKVKALLEAKVS